MSESGNIWPFGLDFAVTAADASTHSTRRREVIVTTRPWWPWSKPKTWHLELKDNDVWFWMHNGQPLQNAPEPVWLSLDNALKNISPTVEVGLLTQRASVSELEDLLTDVWSLANKVHGREFMPSDDAESTPLVCFRPGIADYGAWACIVEIDFTNEGEGRGRSLFGGSLSSVSADIRAELRKRKVLMA